jgi:hypothetical protein
LFSGFFGGEFGEFCLFLFGNRKIKQMFGPLLKKIYKNQKNSPHSPHSPHLIIFINNI